MKRSDFTIEKTIARLEKALKANDKEKAERAKEILRRTTLISQADLQELANYLYEHNRPLYERIFRT